MEFNAHYSYYDILEVEPLCPQNELATAYDRLKSTYSGDNPAIYSIFSENEARGYLQLVEEAYSVLGNKTLRSLYDEKMGHGPKMKDSVSFEALRAESKTIFNENPRKVSAFRLEYPRDEAFEKEISECAQWTGEFLSKVRQYKKVSIEKMSEVTKIGTYYLMAIEKVDPSNLPAPVFVRGYVGQFAKTLALPEKLVCDSYMQNFKKKIENQ